MPPNTFNTSATDDLELSTNVGLTISPVSLLPKGIPLKLVKPTNFELESTSSIISSAVPKIPSGPAFLIEFLSPLLKVYSLVKLSNSTSTSGLVESRVSSEPLKSFALKVLYPDLPLLTLEVSYVA